MANRVRDVAKEQKWREHLDAWRTSGLGIRMYCDRYQLKEQSFYAWRRVLAKRDEFTTMSTLGTMSAQDHPSSQVVRRPVIITKPGSPLVEVHLLTGTVLRVPVDVESITLERILKALQQASEQSVC